MKINQNIFISIIITLLIGSGLYFNHIARTNLQLENKIDENDRTIANLKSQIAKSPSKVKFENVSDKLIETFIETDEYAENIRSVPPYGYLKFEDMGASVSESWAFGQMHYSLRYKENDSNIPEDGKPLPPIIGGFDYILEFNDVDGNLEKLVIKDLNNPDMVKDWNNAIDEIPESVLSAAFKKGQKIP